MKATTTMTSTTSPNVSPTWTSTITPAPANDRFDVPAEWVGEKVFIAIGHDQTGKSIGPQGELKQILRGAVVIQPASGQPQLWPKDSIQSIILDTRVTLAPSVALK